MQAKYIIEAISVLDQCMTALESPAMTPETRGSLIAKCFIASCQLKNRIDFDVKVEPVTDDDYTDYCMRQGELGNPDRRAS